MHFFNINFKDIFAAILIKLIFETIVSLIFLYFSYAPLLS